MSNFVLAYITIVSILLAYGAYHHNWAMVALNGVTIAILIGQEIIHAIKELGKRGGP